VLQRERHGTLLMDHTRVLDLYLRALWQDGDVLVPYSTTFDVQRQPMPYFDAYGMRLPDVYDERAGMSAWTVTVRAGPHGGAPALEHTDFCRQLQPGAAPGDRVFEDARVDALMCANTPACGAFLWRFTRPA
jgi:nitric oxide reductase NorD protein